MDKKRTYTVPVLLIIATLLFFVIVVLYSKLLLTEQSAKTDKGIRLASSYTYCMLLASTLNDDVGRLSGTVSAEERLPIKGDIGKLELEMGECGSSVMVKAQELNGSTPEQAMLALNGVAQPLEAKLRNLGDHDGPLTAEESAIVQKVQTAGAEIQKTLQAYTVPTGDDRYRQMASGVEWPDIALQAFKQLQDLAAALQ
ncbi:hypothetical protein COLU111180_20100 [Cohnella lubricantis]|uniref:Uncharacterized protein n=1 Tax=Cohnella lubricantis TaxID=2163172 RepID=A0A841TFL9_9BACL|nr:hypothetical protein [Cohnella lubricantis]MBB6678749.1 hypothetical protein [Cohnella lubricantis]MBP2119817.1 hypothetical protein [Cohnella lubricantis]